MVWLFGGLTGGVIIFGISLYKIITGNCRKADRQLAIAKRTKSA